MLLLGVTTFTGGVAGVRSVGDGDRTNLYRRNEIAAKRKIVV